jgi:hypothetical protein
MIDRITNDVHLAPSLNELNKEDHYKDRIQLFIEDNNAPSAEQLRISQNSLNTPSKSNQIQFNEDLNEVYTH